MPLSGGGVGAVTETRNLSHFHRYLIGNKKGNNLLTVPSLSYGIGILRNYSRRNFEERQIQHIC